jgi:hypothetical protein
MLKSYKIKNEMNKLYENVERMKRNHNSFKKYYILLQMKQLGNNNNNNTKNNGDEKMWQNTVFLEIKANN